MSAQTIDVIPGFAEASPEERSFLDTHLARERAWYKDTPRFMTDADIETAFQLGKLVEIGTDADIRRIGRFEAEGRAENKPYLTPNAAAVLYDLVGLWRVILWRDYRIQTTETRMSISSMVRSQQKQDMLVADETKLASPDSSHCVGEAFDVDASAYPSIWANGRAENHIHPGRSRSAIEAVQEKIRAKHGNDGRTLPIAATYDYRITEAMIVAAREMHAKEQINLVEEFAGTPNACLHIAANPEYTAV